LTKIILIQATVETNFFSKSFKFPDFQIEEMPDSFDREKVVECMFDSITASILAALEDGEKECSFLAEQESISESEVLVRLSYLIKHGFLIHNTDDGTCKISANSQKLTSIVEDSENFDGTISGLEKMDSYLN